MRQIALLALVFCSITQLWAAKQYSYFRVGNANDVTTTTTAGTVLMGGGTDVDAAFQWMCSRADGGDFLSFARVGLTASAYLDPGSLGCLGIGVPFGIRPSAVAPVGPGTVETEAGSGTGAGGSIAPGCAGTAAGASPAAIGPGHARYPEQPCGLPSRPRPRGLRRALPRDRGGGAPRSPRAERRPGRREVTAGLRHAALPVERVRDPVPRLYGPRDAEGLRQHAGGDGGHEVLRQLQQDRHDQNRAALPVLQQHLQLLDDESKDARKHNHSMRRRVFSAVKPMKKLPAATRNIPLCNRIGGTLPAWNSVCIAVTKYRAGTR